MLLYILSFIILLFAECAGIIRDLFTNQHNRFMSSLFNAIGSILWCLKIIIVIDNPYTVITAGLGAFVGSYIAFWLHNVLIKKSKQPKILCT